MLAGGTDGGGGPDRGEPVDARTIWLVRHGHAGNRTRWVGDDDHRPLSARGWAQARAVAHDLVGPRVGMLVSSPSTRCRQTLEPLADASGLPVLTEAALAEGSDPAMALERLLAHSAGLDALRPDLVACSHGDVIPALLRRLERAGMRREAGTGRGEVGDTAKGSVWELSVRGGIVAAGTYHGVPGAVVP